MLRHLVQGRPLEYVSSHSDLATNSSAVGFVWDESELSISCIGVIVAFRPRLQAENRPNPTGRPGSINGVPSRASLSLTLIIRQRQCNGLSSRRIIYPASTIVSMSARRCSDVDETSATDAIGR
jgi:hypothetical protein